MTGNNGSMTDTIEVTTFDDTMIVAYLMLRGHRVTPRKDPKTDRIKFDIHGDVTLDIRDYYDNAGVGVQEYARCLKEVRNQIYNFKAIKKGKEKEIA